MHLNEALESLQMQCEDYRQQPPDLKQLIAMLVNGTQHVKSRRPNLRIVQTSQHYQKCDCITTRNDTRLHSAISVRSVSPDSSFSTILNKCMSPKSSLEGCEERAKSFTAGDGHSMCKSQTDTIEENELLGRCYMLLVNSQIRMGGTQVINDAYAIHISALKQFFLECYVTSDKFMSLLLAPYRSQVWVTQPQFLRSFQEVHSHILEPLSLYAEDPTHIKKLFTVQKLFCKT